MAPRATIILDFAVSQTWKCLSVPIKKASVFSEAFFDEEILSEIATAANLDFVPGLLQVVQAPTPPDISFFKNLPVKYLGLWAIYSLVLEKAGHIPIVYTGEASDAQSGVPVRWKVYEKPETYRSLLPTKVREALDNGFKITHKGVLAWCPIPSVKDVPRFQVLNYAIEAMFSFLFWTMYSKTMDYSGIVSCCPWPRESFTYGGLCSHSSLNDPMRANLKLSAEQLELLAKTNTRAGKLAAKLWYCEVCKVPCAKRYEYENHKKTPRHLKRVKKAVENIPYKFHCDDCDKDFETANVLRSHKKTGKHLAKVAELEGKPAPPKPVKSAPTRKMTVRTKEERESQDLYCYACGVDCGSPAGFKRHNNGVGHTKRVAKLAAGVVFAHCCEPCGKAFETAQELRNHEKGARHIENVGTGVVKPAPVQQAAPQPHASTIHNQLKEKAEASGRYCNACNVPCSSAYDFERHNNSAKHKNRVAKLAAGVEFNFHCDICGKDFEKKGVYQIHMESDRHNQRAAA